MEEDTWYCERILNEAFISIRQHDVGPIHINIPLVGSSNDLCKKQESISESIKFIEYYSYETDNWELLKNELDGKRVLFVLGQNCTLTEVEKALLNELIYKLNAVVLCDNLTNFHLKTLPIRKNNKSIRWEYDKGLYARYYYYLWC